MDRTSRFCAHSSSLTVVTIPPPSPPFLVVVCGVLADVCGVVERMATCGTLKNWTAICICSVVGFHITHTINCVNRQYRAAFFQQHIT